MLFAIAATVGTYLLWRFVLRPIIFPVRPLKFADKHCLVTGGSSGLGFEVAKELIKRGANVTIVARRKKILEEAVQTLSSFKSFSSQHVTFVSEDLSTTNGGERAVKAAIAAQNGTTPNFVVCCAGASIPGLWDRTTTDVIHKQLQQNFVSAMAVAHTAAGEMVRNGATDGGPKIVLVASLSGLFGLTGYTAYSPSKFAMCGYAECMRQELLPAGIDVHLFVPGNIASPGREEEEKIKPDILRWVEELDDINSPKQVSDALFQGIENGYFCITVDFLGELFRCTNRGAAPPNDFVLDFFKTIIGAIGIPIWRMWVDYNVIKRVPMPRAPITSVGE